MQGPTQAFPWRAVSSRCGWRSLEADQVQAVTTHVSPFPPSKPDTALSSAFRLMLAPTQTQQISRVPAAVETRPSFFLLPALHTVTAVYTYSVRWGTVDGDWGRGRGGGGKGYTGRGILSPLH